MKLRSEKEWRLFNLPRSFYAILQEPFPEYPRLIHFQVYKVRIYCEGKRRLNRVQVWLPEKKWSEHIPFEPNFRYLPNYKKPPPPKKKKWKLEIYVPNPRLVKRRNASDNR
jgi:hypothetical protein